jgi:hypothetical protein
MRLCSKARLSCRKSDRGFALSALENAQGARWRLLVAKRERGSIAPSARMESCKRKEIAPTLVLASIPIAQV